MKRHAALFTLLAFASSAQALELTTDTYYVASIGQSNIMQTPLQSANNGFATNTGMTIRNMQSTQDNVGNAFKLQMGYEFSPRWAIEGGYIDLGKSTYTTHYEASINGVSPPPVNIWGGTLQSTVNINFDPFSFSRVSKISGWNVTGVGSHPINKRLSLIGKLGLMHAEIRSHDTGVSAGMTANATEHRWIATYGVGANYKIDDVFGVRAEFEKYSRIGKDDTTGVTDVNLATVGVSAKF